MLGSNFDFATKVSAEAISLFIEAIFIRRLLSVALLSPSEMVIVLTASSAKLVP
jgi:hypothetical protein